MLFIVVAEQTIQNGWVAIDENARDPCKNQRLVVFSRIYHDITLPFCVEMLPSPASLSQKQLGSPFIGTELFLCQNRRPKRLRDNAKNDEEYETTRCPTTRCPTTRCPTTRCPTTG